MKIKRPIYLDTINLISIILLPLTFFTFLFNYLKKLSPKVKFKVKTLCVGNIYLGGTGKTPTVLKIYQLLKKDLNVVTAKKFYIDQEDEQIILKNNSKFLTYKNRKEIVKKKK